MDRPDLDAVCVSTINPFHAEMALSALEGDKHVLVEYPMALTVADSDRMVLEACRRKRVLHVGHIELLTPEHQILRGAAQAVGPLLVAAVHSLSPDRPMGNEGWTYNRHLFGFPLLGALSRLNRLLDLYGAPRLVLASAKETGTDALGNFQGCFAMTTLFFSGGAIGHVIYGKGAGVIERRRAVEIIGIKGRVIVEEGRVLREQSGQREEIAVPAPQALFAQDTEHFLMEVRGEALPYITPEEARRAVAVAVTAEQAAQTGRSIALAPLAADG